MEKLIFKKFHVDNFRNLSSINMELSPKINCIIGQNAQGKTNLLESIYFLAQRKSFRKNSSYPHWFNLTKNGDKSPIYLMGLLENLDNLSYIPVSVKMEWTHQKPFLNWSLNNILQKTLKNIPKVACIFVDPVGPKEFFSIPSKRRDWFDDQFSQIDPFYSQQLKRFFQLLTMRNALLSDKTQTPTMIQTALKSLDRLFLPCCFDVMRLRPLYLKKMENFLQIIFREIFHQSHTIHLVLQSSWSYRTNLEDQLNSQLMADKFAHKTTKGPHRDEFILMINGHDASHFSSLGEQKCAFFSLVFSFVEYFHAEKHSYPIILLDDISGELDRQRWNQLVGYLEKGKFQSFITTANVYFKDIFAKNSSNGVFEIFSGKC